MELVCKGLQRELIFYPPPPRLAHVPAEVRLPDEPLHGLGERLSRGLAQEARLPVCHALQRAPRVDGNNGAAAVHGLDRNDPEMFSAGGVEHGGAALQQRHLQVVRGGLQESDAVLQVELLRQLFQLGVVLNVLGDAVIVAAGDHQVDACSLARGKVASQDRQSFQRQPQILLSFVSV